MKCLMLSVKRMPGYDCTNGGYTSDHDDIFVPCDEGPFDIPDDHPGLFDLLYREVFGYPSLVLVPHNKEPHKAGPMAGGNYATDSDSRWGKMLARQYGRFYMFNNCLSVHDRWE